MREDKEAKGEHDIECLLFSIMQIVDTDLGPSIKYGTIEGEGIQEGVTVCDRLEGGSKACDVTLLKNCIIHAEIERDV